MAQLYDANGNPVYTDVLQQNQSIVALNGTVSLQLRGQSTASLQITAIGSMTIVVEGSVDGTNWFTLGLRPIPDTGSDVSSFTTTGAWRGSCAGLYQVRARCSAYTSGSATVDMIAAQGSLPLNSPSSGTQAVNLTQVGGNTVTTTGINGEQKVGIVGATGLALDSSIPGTLDNNLKNINGSLVVTVASGVQKVAVVGGTNVSLDGSTAGVLDENIKLIGNAPIVTAGVGVLRVGIAGATNVALDGSTAGVLDENFKLINNVAVSTGSGVTNSGTQRVVIASDDTVAVNQTQLNGSTVATAAAGVQTVGIVGATNIALDGTTAGVLDSNIKNVGGNSVATAAAGVQRVAVVGSTNSVLDGTTPGVLDENIKNVGGSAVVTAATGVQKVGTVGNAGVAFDAGLAAGTAPTNGLGLLGQYNTTTPTPTNAQTVGLQIDPAASLYVNVEGRRQTFRSSNAALTSVAGVSFYVQGSGTKTVKVQRIVISYVSTSTTVAYHDVKIARYSAISGGTNVADTPGKMDTNNAVATAVVNHVTAVNSTQTLVATLANERGIALSSTAAAGAPVQRTEFDFGDKQGQPMVLRGTSDFLGVVFDAATATYDYWVEFTEE